MFNTADIIPLQMRSQLKKHPSKFLTGYFQMAGNKQTSADISQQWRDIRWADQAMGGEFSALVL